MSHLLAELGHQGARLLLAVAGVCLVCSWLLARAATRRTARALVARALHDPSPDVRRSGVLLAVSGGLRTNGVLLARLLDHERDREVRAAVASAVLRNCWEPATTPQLVRLRLWAAMHEQGEDDWLAVRQLRLAHTVTTSPPARGAARRRTAATPSPLAPPAPEHAPFLDPSTAGRWDAPAQERPA